MLDIKNAVIAGFIGIPFAIIASLISSLAVELWKERRGGKRKAIPKNAVNKFPPAISKKSLMVGAVAGLIAGSVLYTWVLPRFGVKIVTVPDVRYLTETVAINRLSQHGLQWDVQCLPTDKVATPGAVYQTVPAPMDPVDRGAEIMLLVAPPCQNADLVRVPNPLGHYPDDAIQRMLQEGLVGTLKCVPPEGEVVEPGKAWSATPPPGSNVRQGSTVEVYVNCP